MSTKTKTTDALDQLADAAQQAGLLLMTAAATVGMLEFPDHANRIVVPNQPALALAGESQMTGDQNRSLRREKEEVSEHSVSYSVAQRTPGRTGKR